MSTSELTEKARQLKELQSLIEDAEQEAEALKDAIKAHMQENGVEECRAGMFKVRWSKVKSSRFDTTAFRATHKELYSQYLRQTETRRFCIV